MLAAILLALFGLLVIWLSPIWFLQVVGVVVVLFAVVVAIDAATTRRF